MKSTDIIQPTAISQPIANSGTRNTISQTATGSGYASVAEGFPDVTMIAPTDGGLPPRGEDCNGLFYLSTDQKAYLQNGGYITFNEEVSELIGGYPQGAMLDYYNSDTNVWAKVISLIENNTNNFVETPSLIDGTNWKYANIAAVSWGSITGTLSNQTDLQNELDTLQTDINTVQSNLDSAQTTLQTNINTVNSKLSNYLPLAGGTMTGTLTMDTGTNVWQTFKSEASLLDLTATPSATQYGGRFISFDNNNNWFSTFQGSVNTSGSAISYIGVGNYVDSSYVTGGLNVILTKSGNTSLTLGNSSNGYNTVDYVKSYGTQYIVFSSGHLIQWGSTRLSKGETVYVTLPKSFGSLAYFVTANFFDNENIDDNPMPFAYTTSSFGIYGTTKGSNDSWSDITVVWTAFGQA